MEQDLEVKTSGIGVYSNGGNVNLNGTIKLAQGGGNNKESIGLYYLGNSGIVTVDNSTNFELEDSTLGIVNTGKGNNITSNVGSITLRNDSIYTVLILLEILYQIQISI